MVKSVIEIDVNDAKFKAFQQQFAAFRKQASNLPVAWQSTNPMQSEFAARVTRRVGDVLAQRQQQKVNEAADKILARSRQSWFDISKQSGQVLKNVQGITLSMTRWVAYRGVFSAIGAGLLGAGSLWGISSLAAGAADARRSAMGVGSSIGGQRGFNINFGRLVDGGQFLGGVSEAMRGADRWRLIAAGLSNSEIEGRSSAEVSVSLMDRIKRLADQTPTRNLGYALSARGLDKFISLQDFERIKATSGSEYQQIRRQAARDAGALGLSDPTAKAWQDLSTQLTRAGQEIENVFVRGLGPLVPGINALSESVSKTLKAFLESDKLKEWIKGTGDGLERLSKHLLSSEFEGKVDRFVTALGTIADAVIRVGGWLGGGSGPRVAGTHTGHDTWNEMWRKSRENRATLGGVASALSGGGYGVPLAERNNNPGNLRPPGASTGFMRYNSVDDGLRAMAHQLRLYHRRDKLSTIQEIVSKYAPRSENDVDAYVNFVSRKTGYGPGQRLDLNDSGTMANLMSAMTKMENHRSNFTPGQIKLVIENPAGANVTVQSNQVAVPQ